MGTIHRCCHQDNITKEGRDCLSTLGELCSSEIEVFLSYDISSNREVQDSGKNQNYGIKIKINSNLLILIFEKNKISNLCLKFLHLVWIFVNFHIYQPTIIILHPNIPNHSNQCFKKNRI